MKEYFCVVKEFLLEQAYSAIDQLRGYEPENYGTHYVYQDGRDYQDQVVVCTKIATVRAVAEPCSVASSQQTKALVAPVDCVQTCMIAFVHHVLHPRVNTIISHRYPIEGVALRHLTIEYTTLC